MNAPQRSAEWFKEREGKLTASTFGQAAGMGPGSRQQLWRRTMKLETFEGNPATQWGEENEGNAVQSFVKHSLPSPVIEVVGFVKHPAHKWLGCSPDILINDDGLGGWLGLPNTGTGYTCASQTSGRGCKRRSNHPGTRR